MDNFINYFTLRCRRCKSCNKIIGAKQKRGYCDDCKEKKEIKQKDKL